MPTEEERDGVGRKCKEEKQDGTGKKQHFRENIKIPGCIIYTVSIVAEVSQMVVIKIIFQFH